MPKNITLMLLRLALFSIFFFSMPTFAQDDLSSDEYYALAKKEGNEKQNFAKAAVYCEKALKLAPLDMDIKEYLGKCYMETGQLEKARIVLLEVLDKSPRRTDARHYLLNIETRTKRYSSAVCYANELLEITPYSKTLWMRKINLYNLMNNRIEAHRATRRLYQIYPEDEEVKALYNNVLKEDALKMNKGGNAAGAAKQYEEALQVSNNDPELYLNLINLHIKSGEYPAALATADRGLTYLPNNRQIIDKKIAVLQEMGQYQKAIDLVNAQIRKGNSGYNDMLVYLTAEAARYYKNSDPYELYGQLYERDKGNKEAHDYLLNTAISRGYFADAQEMLTKALKADPNSKELLSKQLYVYESQNNNQGARTTIEKLYRLYPGDADIAAKYDAVLFQEAKVNFAEENYKDALPVFIRLSQHPDFGKSAKGYIYSVYLKQKQYDKALEQVNKLIRQYPAEQDYILKKIDLLADMQDYENAFELVREYRQKYPERAEYAYMLNDLSVDYIKYLNEREDYATAKLVADGLVAANPDNQQAYDYAIGARISLGQYDEAQQMIQAALVHFPESKELRLKQAGVYTESGQHEKAVEALRELHKDYPYNSNIKGSLVEAMLMAAKQKEERHEYLQAMDMYREVLLIKPKDTVAPIKLANLHIAREEYPEAMKVVDTALEQNKDNPDLLYLKGLIFEKMNNYKLAREYQGKYIPPVHKLAEHKDHLDYLEAKMLKNQVILSYLKATTDSIPFNTSVATVEYLRFENNNTYVGRVNYAARNTGVGVQGEIDWYHTFKDKAYTLANVGVANRFFQKYKVGISYFEPFKNSWMGEVGVRYAGLTDDRNLITGIIGIEKSYERLWLNVRVSLLSDSDDFYHSVLGQARFYMRNGRDYALAMASVGTAPEDQKLDFQTNTFLSYVNTMVGAGYFYNANHRTTLGIMGNWYNYRISSDYYLNQYNLFVTLRTRF
jgi:YaiO family outer membrane protein